MLFVASVLVAVYILDPPWGYALIAGAGIVEIGETLFWLRLSRRRRIAMGPETLVGAIGVVVAACRPEGQVRVDGELWHAVCPEGADVGATVRVKSRDGLTLAIEVAD